TILVSDWSSDVCSSDLNSALGTFDGKQFTRESGKHRGNYGNCFYASQTFSDIPRSDGRRIQIGWGRVSTPGMPFNQIMLFPCERSEERRVGKECSCRRA